MVNKILLILCCVLLSLILPAFSLAENGTTTVIMAKTDPAAGKPARSTDMEEMLLFFEEKDLIVTATKHTQTLQDAPAIATVITAEEIRNMGARDIIDVLRQVPGVGVSKGFHGKREIEVRGMKTVNSEKVMMMQDGHPLNDNVTGGATWSFDDVSVENVKRIEIIRGPGSALYGSNAFSGVINIVTKDGDDIDGGIVSVGGGSFNTKRADLQWGKKSIDLNVAFSLDYLKTDGAKLRVKQDVIGNSGDTNNFEEKVDANLKIAYKEFYFNSKFVSKQRGAFIGVANALNDSSQVSLSQYFSELGYKMDVTSATTLGLKLFIDEMRWDGYWEIYPANNPGIFPGKMLANPSLVERGVGAEVQLDFKLSDDNMLTAGLFGEEKKSIDVGYKANYDPRCFSNPIYCAGFVLPSFQDVRSLGNWNAEEGRTISAVYLQDQWNVLKDASLTFGVRHDHYSDFGDTTNPRAAIVWKVSKEFDVKLLYGTAFRAPSFEELYNANNPVVNGNKDLRPEKMRTYEASVGYGMESIKSRISYFNNSFSDKIQRSSSSPAVFVNQGGAEVQGVEAEFQKNFSKDTYISANYTFQWPKDTDTGKRLPDVPTHKGNIGGNIGLTRYLTGNMNIFTSSERPREEGDPRASLPSYSIVDLSLITKNFWRKLEIRASAHNLFDTKYEDPAPRDTVPGDYPREGVSYLMEAYYKF